ncbi:hypothetical protein PCANB_002597 [Pneumocystis canis]|nr:hypothetical protein PCANB_002597 [Pneumocystis canis]
MKFENWLKETNITVDQLLQGQSVYLNVLRMIGDEEEEEKKEIPLDPEGYYSKMFLASQSSIFIRKIGYKVNKILWRVVYKNILELIPIETDESDVFSNVNLYISFPSKIKSYGVVLIDEEDKDSFKIHVLTSKNFFYTLSFTSNHFNNQYKFSENSSSWCSVFRSCYFDIRAPHFFISITPDRIVFSLKDGGLVMFEKNEQNEYIEIPFSDGSYFSSFKAIFLWGLYKNDCLSSNLIISMQASLTYSLLFTISLDGKLKVWSLNRRILLKTYNAWNDQRVFDPQPRCLISILEKPSSSGYKFYLLTFTSVIESGFILWGATHFETTFSGLVNLTSYANLQMRLSPPTNNSVWVVLRFTLSNNFIKNEHDNENNTKSKLVIWVLWKSNTSSIIQFITIDPLNSTLMNEEWNTLIPTHKFLSKKISPVITFETSPHDVSEYWYRKILTPGQFSSVTIRTALEIYQYRNHSKKHLNDNKTHVSFNSLQELKEIVYKEINTIVTLQRDLYNGLLLFDKYRQELNAEWIRFLRLCTELEELGSEPLDLIYDSTTNFVFVVKANAIGIINKCIFAEIIHYHCLNKRRDDPRFQKWCSPKGDPIYSHIGNDITRFDIAQLFFISNKFLDDFSDMQILFVKQVLEEEIRQKHSFSIGDRIWILSDRIFGQHIEASKVEDINLIFNDISDPIFAMTILLQCLINDKCFHLDTYMKRKSVLNLNMVTLSIYQIVYIYYDILLRMLLVLVFIGCYNSNMQKITGFYQLFNDYLCEFREYCCIRECCSYLLNKTDGILVLNNTNNQIYDTKVVGKRNIERLYGFESTLRLFLHEFYIFKESKDNIARKLVDNFSLRILGLFKDGYEMSFCVGALLFQFKYLLEAMEIASWISFMPLGIYLKARIFLSYGKLEKSSVLFKRASVGTYMTHSDDIISNVLKDFGFSFIFNNLYLYFIHVADIYYQEALYFYSAEFYEEAKKIGLEKLDEPEKENLYNKMFQAYIAAKMYDNAYLTLLQFQSYEAKSDALYKLVDMMCGENLSEKLCEYSFFGLSEELDSILYFKAQSMIDVRSNPCYHKILYSWRVKQGNFRGAASIMYDRLQKLRSSSLLKNAGNQEQIDIVEGYLALLSALSCVDTSNSWILYPDIGPICHSNKRIKYSCSNEIKKRQILDITAVRKEYMMELKQNQSQDTLIEHRGTQQTSQEGEDIHIHRQIKAHKTFVVHGRHHTRVPSYARNSNKMGKNTILTASMVQVMPDESEIPENLVDIPEKYHSQMEMNNIIKNVVQDAEKEDSCVKNKGKGHFEESVQAELLEKPLENDISYTNVETCFSQHTNDVQDTKCITSHPSRPITSRIISIKNHQIAMPYLTRETATVKNTATQLTHLEEKDSSLSILSHFDNTNDISTEPTTTMPATSALKSVVSDPSFKKYINRTHEKPFLERELNLSCIKSCSKTNPNNYDFMQRQIDYIDEKYTNISRFINPSKHVILKLFHNGSLEGIKQTSNSLHHKSPEEKSGRNISKVSDFIGKHDNHSKGSNKLNNEQEYTAASIQMILEKMWQDNEHIS